MGHIEATKNMSASPAAVWATVADTSTWGKWFTVHDSWIGNPPASLAVGANLTAKMVMLGMTNTIEWTVTAVDEPSKLELSGTGLAGVKVVFSFTIEPDGERTKFSVAGDFEGAMIKGALGKAVEKDGRKQLDRSVEKLDAVAIAGSRA